MTDYSTLHKHLEQRILFMNQHQLLHLAANLALKMGMLHRAGFIVCDFPNVGVSSLKDNTFLMIASIGEITSGESVSTV